MNYLAVPCPRCAAAVGALCDRGADWRPDGVGRFAPHVTRRDAAELAAFVAARRAYSEAFDAFIEVAMDPAGGDHPRDVAAIYRAATRAALAAAAAIA